jgi:DNA-binding beta-propeller fold protein YncE
MAGLTRREAGWILGGALVIGAAKGNDRSGDWSGARIFRLAGTGEAGFSGDGGSAVAAKLNGPAGIAVDRLGNVLIADTKNHAIRRVCSGKIATIAGTGAAGFSGDGAAAANALLNRPEGVAADRFGNIYIADSGNDRIRRIAPGGKIETFAGGGAEDPRRFDGPARAVQLSHPAGVVVDDAGVVYFNDYGHDIVCAVTADGNVRRVAGTGTPGYSGDGGQAREAEINDVYGLAFDSDTALYICDSLNFAIRRVQAGYISTAVKGLSGTPHPKCTTGQAVPHGVDADSSGNIYVADTAAHRLAVHSGRDGRLTAIAGSGRPGALVSDGTPALQADVDIHGVRRLPGGELVFNDFLHNAVYRIARA